MADINLRGELKKFALRQMSGQAKFLAVAAIANGFSSSQVIELGDIKKNWLVSHLKAKFSTNFYLRAQDQDWVIPVNGAKSTLRLTDKGLDELAKFRTDHGTTSEFRKEGQLLIFHKKSAHTIDKYIRSLFRSASKGIWVADSYVDEGTFDNTLDSASKGLTIKLLYGSAYGTFESRGKRFKIEYPNFYSKKYKSLHDRFVIVDDKGYIIGPSLKDAATKSPAIVVELEKKESSMLKLFFEELWKEN